MNKKYIVRLSEEERSMLKELVSKGKAAAYRIKHANMLLQVDADGVDWGDEQAAEACSCSPRTVFNIRQRFVEQGLDAALLRKKRERPPTEPLLDGEKEARLVQIACGEPPAGQARWTLRMLAEELIALEVVASISAPTVMRTLKKTVSVPRTTGLTLKPRVLGGEMLRQEGVDRGGGVRGGEALEEEVEVGAGLEAVGLGALHEGIQGGAGLGTAGAAAEQPSLSVMPSSA